VFKISKLEIAEGCVYCKKQCQFNGQRVDADSRNAAKRDNKKMLVHPGNQNLYGCNSTKY
jgi:hypothetical protein